MELVTDNNFLKITTSANHSLTYFEWKAATDRMTVDEFVPLCKKIMQTVLDTNSKLLFENCTHLNFPVPPEIQELVATQMISQFNGRLNKLAHLYSENFISRLSQEQIWAENKDHSTYEEEFFSSKEEAEKWLLA